jgi:hypothetical protein
MYDITAPAQPTYVDDTITAELYRACGQTYTDSIIQIDPTRKLQQLLLSPTTFAMMIWYITIHYISWRHIVHSWPVIRSQTQVDKLVLGRLWIEIGGWTNL